MSLTFNGTDQYISAASIPGNVGFASRTVAFWVQTTNNATRQFIYSEGDESGTYTRFALEFDASSPFTVNLRSVGYTGTTVPSNNTWYHVAATLDDNTGNITLYVNGVQEAFQGGTSINTSGSNFNLGRYYGGSFYLSGKMAEVAKWNTYLSVDHIAALAKGFSPKLVNRSELAFYAPLVREIQDIRGGLALTNNNTATVSDHPRVYAG